jgi:hypothetical protein
MSAESRLHHFSALVGQDRMVSLKLTAFQFCPDGKCVIKKVWFNSRLAPRMEAFEDSSPL